MINLTSAEQQIVKSDSTRKNFRVHFPNGERSDITNDEIVFESVQFTESVCKEQSFRFGCTEASVIEFETVGVENIVGMTIECSMTFTLGDDSVTVPYGVFIVDSCPRDHQNMTHRKVTGYSLLAYLESLPNFVQGAISTPEIRIYIDALLAYASNDTSGLQESVPSHGSRTFDTINLYDSSGIPYTFIPRDADDNVPDEAYGYPISFPNYIGYKYTYQQTGTVTNDEVGMAVADWLDTNGYDLTYDANGKKVFETNEEALRAIMLYMFTPIIAFTGTTPNNYYATGYKPIPAIINQFAPMFDGTIDDSSISSIYSLGNTSSMIFQKGSSANVYSSGFSWLAIDRISVGDYQVSTSIKQYQLAQGDDTTHIIPIKSTLQIDNVFMYGGRVGTKDKWFYGTMYAYGNAYSCRELLDGWAELNGAFIHSERDGTISMEALDNTTPYSITAADIDGAVWWDEYNVLPIGTIRYTFTNPYTEQVESGTIRISDNPSVYDLSGNKVIESIDFRTRKLSALGDYMSPCYFYRYQGNFYYTEEGVQHLGGMYKDVTSIVEYVIRKMFVPHIPYVNFTPMEMNLRGMPYLEAGDAITFTAEDGTVIQSYLLNHTMDGIQYIQEQVTSVAGDVI